MSQTDIRNGTSHILVVDDEPEIAESLADFLARKGYVVTTAVDGTDALAVLERAAENTKGPVDLVLLDMQMPQMPGQRVLDWIRSHPDPDLKYTRVVMLTAASSNRDKVDLLNAGADDYITKPYQATELLARVHTILRTQQLEKQLQRQSQQLADLNRIISGLTGTVEMRQVFAQAAEGIADVLGAPVAAVFTRLLNQSGLHCQYLSGDQMRLEQYAPIPIGQGVIGQTLARPQVFRVNDVAQEQLIDQSSDSPPQLTLHSIMSVPIVVRGSPWGVLAVFNKADGDFTEFDLDLLASLSSSLGDVIENAWLVQSLRQRQQDLLDSRNTLQAIIDGILHPIYTIDDDWRLVSVNQNKADEKGLDFSALVGEVCYKAFFGRTEPCEHCLVAATLRRKTAQTWSVRWLGEDHLPREWDLNAYPVPGKTAGSASAVIVWQDRTEERRLERSLLQAGKLAAIGQLAAGVAHEINNPLTAVNANAEMLKMTLDRESDEFEAADLIHRAGLRAAKVVGGLLDFAREHKYTFVPLDINRSIEQALELVAYQLHIAHVEVEKDMAADVPLVAASSEHIKSVWINLLVNARDAMRDAEVENPQIRVTTRFDTAQDQVQVIFQDNGPGISKAEAAHIFEPFYTTKDPGKGTGLGLATCLRIIEQHGGEIEMISDVGQGATFVIRLPVNPADVSRLFPDLQLD